MRFNFSTCLLSFSVFCCVFQKAGGCGLECGEKQDVEVVLVGLVPEKVADCGVNCGSEKAKSNEKNPIKIENKQPVLEKVKGYDAYGKPQSCAPSKSLFCTQVFLQPEDELPIKCKKAGGEVVQCGCHSYLCSINLTL